MHLAVVPAGVTRALVDRLADCGHVHVLQHGLAHLNHAAKGSGASEFGADRALATQLDDLGRGWQLLVAAGLARLLPVVVPPWNRMADATLPALPALGYRAISAFEGPTRHHDIPGLLQLHALVDPIRWKEGRSFRGEATMLALILDHLAARREGRAPGEEPTGILTHHLQTGPEVWAFLDRLMARLAAHGSARWVPLSALIAET